MKRSLQFQAPVNRFPDFVRYVVQRFKALCPGMGQVKMAQTLNCDLQSAFLALTKH